MEPVVIESGKPRRPPRKKVSLWRVIFYLTSLLPAIWIGWQLTKLQQRLNQQAAAPKIIQVPPAKATPRAAPVPPSRRTPEVSPKPEPRPQGEQPVEEETVDRATR